MAETQASAPQSACTDCGGPKRAGKGVRCDRCARKRRNERYAELKALFEAGKYEPGMYYREATCKGCARVFPVTRHDAWDYCSRECCFSTRNHDMLRREARTGLVTLLSRRRQCAICDSIFSATYSHQVYCSDACRAEQQRRYHRQRAVANCAIPARPCRECGIEFEPEYGSKRRKFCSLRCAKRSINRIQRKRERARLRTLKVEAVDPTKVFDRDGWRCHLCGRKTPRRLRGTYHDRAPQLDHILPLSCGGEHSYANTACACKACNAAKGGMPMGQLMLFEKA